MSDCTTGKADEEDKNAPVRDTVEQGILTALGGIETVEEGAVHPPNQQNKAVPANVNVYLKSDKFFSLLTSATITRHATSTYQLA